MSRYIENLREVFDAVWHVLADDGVLWLNIGDSYAGSGRGAGSLKMGYVQRNSRGTHGVPPDRDKSVRAKNLYGIPWRLALALQQDGWNIRADVVWHKPNPMPESVKDRPTRSHEHVFMLTKRTHGYRYHADQLNAIVNPDANTRDVWSIQPAKFPGAHFATFPTELVERCIAAGSTVGEVVFDPFAGAGTTGMVARQMGRRFVGAEINEEYASMARSRIASATPRLEMAT